MLSGYPGVRQVILFGSLAAGAAGSRSDLDLVIVQDTDKRFMDRLDEFYRLLVPTVETDILVYTPQEWETLVKTREFVRRIASGGVTLYETVGA
jgi:predicted nucleotidyltransferase